MLQSIPDKKVYVISRYDIQAEAVERLGRFLNDIELDKAGELLEWGIGESINFIYDSIFSEIENV